MPEDTTQIPVASQKLLDSAGETYKTAIKNVFMIYCPTTNNKGTGFLYEDGSIITNHHVIKNENPEKIIIITYDNKQIKIKKGFFDGGKDLAKLIPSENLGKGLSINEDVEVKPGMQVITWGHPLAYNGPSPILSVGYISGFKQTENKTLHYIVNGAFNPGNSGGPLLIAGTNDLIGVVVSKHLPITKFQASALKVLASNTNGLQYTGTNEKGEQVAFAESQIVADFLKSMRDLTQVMLGEAIMKDSLKQFIEATTIKK